MKLKDKYKVDRIDRLTAKSFLDKYHYLHENGNFRSGINYGLIDKSTLELIGVVVYHTNSAKYLVKGCFGIDSYKLDGLYELGRLCIHPHRHEKNITSFFLSLSIKKLRKVVNLRALLTYADSDYHNGYVYQACNFKYYGLTDPKKDFFIKQNDGTFKKLQRGKCRHLDGEWRDKSQKHRYLIIYDKSLKTIWNEKLYPKGKQVAPLNNQDSNKIDVKIIAPKELQRKLF